jgi:hypothetical protein
MPVAQINIARFSRAHDDPANAAFFAALARVNAMAEAADGFVWRLVNDADDAMAAALAVSDPDLAINLSVWRDVAALETFVYRQADHRAVLARRRDWFGPTEPYLALWPVAAGHVPSVDEGFAKLAQIAAHGPGKAAFTFAWYKQNRALAAV